MALNQSELILLRLVKELGLDAEVFRVNEGLEHGRMGISEVLPVLEINGLIVTKKQTLNEETLRPICERLASLFEGSK